MAGEEALTAFIDGVRRLGRLPEDAAKLAAPLVLEAVQATARAGTTPDGRPWHLTVKGQPALVHAAEHLSVKTLGPVVQLTLRGPDAIHNYGAGTTPQRQVLPDGGSDIPATIVTAVGRAAKLAFEKSIGGGT